jgi:hypothetical protein
MQTSGSLPLFFLLIFVIGCGPRTSDVNGTVTYKGKPVRIGNVMLSPDKGAHTYAELKDDGTFTALKVPVGSCRVTVTSPDPARPVIVKGESVAKKGPADPRWFALPSNASDPEKSGLRFEVTSGVNNWEVKVND